VLPFASSQSGETEYLTDGITESLINGLAQLPDLRVSARSVVFKHKNKDVDPQQVGRDLNVRAIVTGRVSVRGDQLVIQAELMNVETGAQIWGDQYNRPQSDLLAVQDEIATEILDKIRPRLSGRKRKRRAGTPKTRRPISCTSRADFIGTKAPWQAIGTRSNTSNARYSAIRSTRSLMPGWPTRT
jgi:TolB-like protein